MLQLVISWLVYKPLICLLELSVALSLTNSFLTHFKLNNFKLNQIDYTQISNN